MNNALQLVGNAQIMRKLGALSPLGDAEFVRAAHVLQAQIKTPALARCSQRSVLLACVNVAKLGLNPDPQLGHVYIVPFGEQATVIIGYKGYIELARRSERVTIAKAELIYTGDLFEFEERWDRTHFRHAPAWLQGHERGELIGGFALIQFVDGARQVTPVPLRDIEAARKRSRASSNGPWVTDLEMMQRKTVVRRAATYWPLSAELGKAIELDRRADDGEPQGDERDFADVLDVEPEAMEPGTHSMKKDRKERNEEEEPPTA